MSNKYFRQNFCIYQNYIKKFLTHCKYTTIKFGMGFAISEVNIVLKPYDKHNFRDSKNHESQTTQLSIEHLVHCVPPGNRPSLYDPFPGRVSSGPGADFDCYIDPRAVDSQLDCSFRKKAG